VVAGALRRAPKVRQFSAKLHEVIISNSSSAPPSKAAVLPLLAGNLKEKGEVPEPLQKVYDDLIRVRSLSLIAGRASSADAGTKRRQCDDRNERRSSCGRVDQRHRRVGGRSLRLVRCHGIRDHKRGNTAAIAPT
jgi:hypothetical protein